MDKINDGFVCIWKPSRAFSTQRKKFSMKALDLEVGVIKYNRHKCTLISLVLFIEPGSCYICLSFYFVRGHNFHFSGFTSPRLLREFAVISFQKKEAKSVYHCLLSQASRKWPTFPCIGYCSFIFFSRRPNIDNLFVILGICDSKPAGPMLATSPQVESPFRL